MKNRRVFTVLTAVTVCIMMIFSTVRVYAAGSLEIGVQLTDCVLTDADCSGGDSGGIVAARGNSSERYVAGIITGEQVRRKLDY